MDIDLGLLNLMRKFDSFLEHMARYKNGNEPPREDAEPPTKLEKIKSKYPAGTKMKKGNKLACLGCNGKNNVCPGCDGTGFIQI